MALTILQVKYQLPLIVLHSYICFSGLLTITNVAKSYHAFLFWLFIMSLPFINSDTLNIDSETA